MAEAKAVQRIDLAEDDPRRRYAIERHKHLLLNALPSEAHLPGLKGLASTDGSEKTTLGHTTITVDQETGSYVVRYVVELGGPQLALMDDEARLDFVERAAVSFAADFGKFWGVAAGHASLAIVGHVKSVPRSAGGKKAAKGKPAKRGRARG